MKIGIVVIATNAYFPLGIRFVKKFNHHYKGEFSIVFHLFCDEDPKPYLEDSINVVYHYTSHTTWRDGTNSKFSNILSIQGDEDYLYYFDADTNVKKDFTEKWFLGDIVGGEHFGNRTFLSDGKGFDRNPRSKAYVPEDSKLPYTYHYGAFFGGHTDKVLQMCKTLRDWQLEDKKINYEPGANDESYINCYFHFNPPFTVRGEDFAFVISDKGSMSETRDTRKNITNLKKLMLQSKDKLYEISVDKLVEIKRE
jgi:hypothetical protein